MKSKPEVSIIIVSFNTREFLLECIKSIQDETIECSYEIIVYDNCSGDGSPSAVEAGFPEVKVVRGKSNIGFAQANNAAAGLAEGERILFLNPDTIILDGAIDRIVAFANSRAGALIWGGRAEFSDGTLNASCWRDMTLWALFCRMCGLTWLFPTSRVFNPETMVSERVMSKEREVDIVVGCFLLIEGWLWRELGGFNPRFFMYGDEVDLCLRARRSGARPVVTPHARIVHHGGASEVSTEDKIVKVFRGRVTVMKEHWPRGKVLIGRLLLLSTAGMRAVAGRIVRPPKRRGGGQDGRRDVWAGVFRRRGEWCAGWADPEGSESVGACEN